MTQVLVSIEKNWAIDSVMDAIRMLRGVASAKIWKTDETLQSASASTKKYSPRIEKLQQLCGTGITQEDIEKDDRLAYLLSK